MDPIRSRWSDQQPGSNGLPPQPPSALTVDDIARLSAKREEIIATLRLWHGYGRNAADQALSRWLYQNSSSSSRHI